MTKDKTILSLVILSLFLSFVALTRSDSFDFLEEKKGLTIFADIPAEQRLRTYIENTYADLNGDGEKEFILSFSLIPYSTKDKNIDFAGYIAAYNNNLEEVARTSEDFTPIYSTLSGHMQAYQFDKSSKREYLRLRKIAGSHQFDNLFLTMRNDRLIPVCKTENPEKLSDCIFYNTVGEIDIRDFDDDGKTEIIEYIDEYPPTGGRGDIVVGGIYEFNGKYFNRLSGKDYEKIFAKIKSARDKQSAYKPEHVSNFEPRKLMRSSELDPASRENLEKIKRFWQRK